MGLEHVQRNQFQGAPLARLQPHRRRHAVVVGLKPAGSAHAPVIARAQTREAVLGGWRGQIIALGQGVTQEALIHHAADGMAPEVAAIGAAVAIAVPAGHGFTTTDLEGFTQHVEGGGGAVSGWCHGAAAGKKAASLTKLWNKIRAKG